MATPSFPLGSPRVRTALSISMLSLALAACGTSPKSDVSLIPDQTEQLSSRDGAFTQPLKYTHTKPGCTGTCPRFEVDSLVFPGKPALTAYIENTLVKLIQADLDIKEKHTLATLEQAYWAMAGSRDEVILAARTPYRNTAITVVELTSYYYPSSAAHGMTQVQFVNWDNQAQRALTLKDMLLPGKQAAYDGLLRQAHQRWLADNEAARDDPNNYQRMWPFQASDNVGLSDQGLQIKYNSYEIAPYSSGQPVLVIPYTELKGILRPAFLPR